MMQFFTNLFGPAFGPTVAYLSLLLIVVAIALIAWFSYRSMNRTRLGAGNRNRQTRLAITDVALVDKHRRLVLLRRDEVEHLIMIGGHSDLVIESDIRRNAPARPRAAPENKPAAVPPMQKRPEQVAKQLPNEPMASPVAANGSNSKPAAATGHPEW